MPPARQVKTSTVGDLGVPAAPLGTRDEAAAYVASHAGELAKLMRWYHLDTLSYLLDMVRLEAEDVARR